MSVLTIGLGLASFFSIACAIWLAVRLRSSARSQERLRKHVEKFEDDMVMHRDIERELAHMASFAELSPHPIIEINADHAIGYINPAAEKCFPILKAEPSQHPLMKGLSDIIERLIK